MGIIHTDYHGVIERGDFESGDYSFEIKSVKDEVGKNGPYVRCGLQFQDGKYAGLMHELIVSFAKGALWRSKSFLKAVGYTVPDGPFSFNSDDLVGCQFKAHGERTLDPEGKYPPKLELTQYFPKDHMFEIVMPPASSSAKSSGPAAEVAPPPSQAPAPAPAPAPANATETASPPSRPKLKV